MLDNLVARASIGRVTDPLARRLVRLGVPADAVTVLGTVGTVVGALWFFPMGWLVTGALVVTAFVLCDLLDGAMARARDAGGPPASEFGAVLDSTCDRISDGAVFAGLAWWCLHAGGQPYTAIAAMTSLVVGQVVSYIKARAEASGLSAVGGLVERAERLTLALVGTIAEGFGVPGALAVALWLLAAGSVITLGQRLVAVYRSAAAAAGPVADGPGPGPVGPPDGGAA